MSSSAEAKTAYEPLRDEIFEAVKRVIADSLMIAPDEIHPESALIDELGADSLDFVDIVFTLDREFDIRVRDSEFNFLTRLDFSSPEVLRDGFLTRPVVERLQNWLPAIQKEPDLDRISPRRLFSLITVQAICIVVQRRIDAQKAAAAN